MPKSAKGTKYRKTYEESVLQKALEEIRQGAAIQSTAKKYSLPRSTVQFRLGSKFRKVRPGPNTVLTKEEEDLLEEWINECARKGFPRRKQDIKAAVKIFLKEKPRPHSFKELIPGEHWYKSFLLRHPDLSIRTAESVTKASSNISEKDIRSWFSTNEQYLKEKNWFDVLKEPSRIFNADETCFLLCPKGDKVIAPKGSKNVYEVDVGAAKQNITVMFCFCANGETTPPLVIYPYKRLPAEISAGIPGDWGIGK